MTSGQSSHRSFQSTPSAWRETISTLVKQAFTEISIHSLRMEGDQIVHSAEYRCYSFQSTPSAWRETPCAISSPTFCVISIHSLRMEGDRLSPAPIIRQFVISIHSLRMEGDSSHRSSPATPSLFQSTPSAWRETAKLHRKAFFISPILVQSCKKGCKRLHSAPEKMVFFEKREKNLVRNLQHLSVRL